MKNNTFSILAVSLLFILGYGCQEYNSEQQQLWDEVMVVHDEVMPKMGELHQLKKQLAQQETSPQVTTAIQRVETAQEAMMDWMRNFKSLRELSKIDHTEAMDYLEKEQRRIAEVKRLMLTSIEKGNALVKK